MNRLRNLMTSILMLVAFITVSVPALAAVDTTAPTTSAALTGTIGRDCWYTTSVTVTLSATDGTDGSGVAKTEYSLDSATWLPYSAPFVLDKNGAQYIYFRSIDLTGNIEAPTKSQNVKINKTGLVGLWHMDGDWKDESVVGNHGTPTNGVTFSPSAKVGTQAGNFDGLDDYVSIPDDNTLSPQAYGQMSISAWVYVRAYPFGGQNRAPVIAKGTGSNYEYALYVYSDGRLGLSLWRPTGSDHISVSGGTIPLNTWTYVAGVYNYSAAKKAVIYMNGAEIASNSTTTGYATNGSSPVDIGRRPDGAAYQYLNALIDEVAIYNHALSDIEVRQQFIETVVSPPTVNPVPSPTSSVNIILTGSKPANTAIMVNGSIQVPLDGANTWQANYLLSPGTNNLVITARDSQDNSSLPVSLQVFLDSTPPIIDATPAGGIYNSGQIVTLTASEPGDIYYTLDGATPTISSTRYCQPISVPASMTLKYFGKDLTGNNSEIKTENYVIDVTPPVLTISTLSDGAYTNNETLNIAGTVTDETNVNEITINGAITPLDPDNSFSYALLLQSGINSITITATDSVGNQAADTRTVILDQAAPVLTVTEPADNSKTGNMLLEVSGTVDEASAVMIRTNDSVQSAAMDDASFSATTILEPGYNTIEITATDLAGNQSALKRTVLYDNQKPSLAINEPNQDMRTSRNALTLKGSVSDTLTAVGVTIRKGNELLRPQVVNGRFEQTLDFTEEKTYDIVVTATNEVGSSTSVQRNIIYDITPPVLSIDPVSSPTSLSSLSVSGTREAGAVVTVTCATATVDEVFYPTETTWSVDILGLTEGKNVITAASADAAGNAVTARTKVVLASIPPQIMIMATPDVIWPPKHKMMPVTITGGVNANGSDIESVHISVSDEYGKCNYNDLTFGSTIMLEAWRNGNDKDGRTYTITVDVTNEGGLTASKTATVTVLHDKAKQKDK